RKVKVKEKSGGRTPKYKPTKLCGRAYRERLKIWYKNGELSAYFSRLCGRKLLTNMGIEHVYGPPKADALENHKQLIQDAIGDTIHLVAEVEAENLVQNKINYMESLRDKSDAKKESKCVQSRIF